MPNIIAPSMISPLVLPIMPITMETTPENSKTKTISSLICHKNSNSLVLSIQVLPTILAFVVAFVVGIFAIKLMMKLTTNSNLKWFLCDTHYKCCFKINFLLAFML